MSNATVLAPETVQATIDRYFAASRAAHDKVAGMVDCFVPDTISYDPVDGPALVGHAGLSQHFQGIVDLFTEVGLTADFVSIHGQEAAIKWTGRGLGKNGVLVTFEGIDMMEFSAEGKIQTLRACWNPIPTIVQLQ